MTTVGVTVVLAEVPATPEAGVTVVLAEGPARTETEVGEGVHVPVLMAAKEPRVGLGKVPEPAAIATASGGERTGISREGATSML